MPVTFDAAEKAGTRYMGSSRILVNRTFDFDDVRQTDIFTIRPDGTSLHRLTNAPGERFAGSYSRDGSRIAYVEGGVVGALWIMRSDGTEASRVGTLNGSCPRFSPGGNRIAYRTGEPGEIWLASPDGSNAHRISGGSRAEHDQCPSWSPDGTMISFVRFNAANQADVWVMRDDGTDARRLTTDGQRKTVAAWSPDGRSIAYDRAGDIWMMAADGSQQTQLTDDPEDEMTPVWSRRSNKIAYAKAAGAHLELWVRELTGRNYAVGISGSPAGWRGH